MESLNSDAYFQAIEKHGRYVGTTVGVSMLPMLRSGKDSIVIERPKEKLKKYDCVMYKRNNGKYVLHRIIDIKDGKYVICGDNQWQKEYGIKDDQIIGVLTGFYRKEKYIGIDKLSYRLYYHMRVFFRPLRKVRDKVRGFLSKIKHKIFDKKKDK